MKKHVNCLVCNSAELKKMPNYYQKNELIKCKSCGFVFMQNTTSLEELDAHYSQYAYGSEGYLSPITIKSYNVTLDEFEKYRKTGKILDVGCGRGWFLEEARKRGWEVYGTEYSETAIAVCEKAGINMKAGQLSAEMFPAQEVNVITALEVIEHINNPTQELPIINTLLRKGGLFYCTTPNFNSIIRYYLKADYNIIGYPENVGYYTKRTLNRVVKNAGLKPVKCRSTGISITRSKT